MADRPPRPQVPTAERRVRELVRAGRCAHIAVEHRSFDALSIPQVAHWQITVIVDEIKTAYRFAINDGDIMHADKIAHRLIDCCLNSRSSPLPTATSSRRMLGMPDTPERRPPRDLGDDV